MVSLKLFGGVAKNVAISFKTEISPHSLPKTILDMQPYESRHFIAP